MIIPVARREVRIALAAVCVMVLVALWYSFVGGGGLNAFTSPPSFPALSASLEPRLHGTVAYNALAIGTPQGKWGCGEAVRVDNGSVRRLFCAEQPKAMGADLRWRADGRLEATDQYGARWRKVVDLATDVVTTQPGVRVAPTVAHDSVRVPGPDAMVVTSVRTRGSLIVRLTTSTSTRTLLDLGVPRDYSFTAMAWNPDGSWIVAEDSLARLLVISTGARPSPRVLVDGGWGPAATDREFAVPRHR